MSGIFALYYRDGREAPCEALAGGARVLGGHGRAAATSFTDGPLGLAVAPSTSLPRMPGDARPLLGGGGRFVMVFDGRLDNREELAAVVAPHIDLDRTPDDALAMRCWERWQAGTAARLLGDFALIVWDKAERRLHAARDHFGVRPLSYHLTPDVLVVATSPAAIFASRLVERGIDRQKLADTLVGNYRDASRSFFTGISRLPPAHALAVDRYRFTVERYWRLDHDRRISLDRDEDYVDQARELLDRSVRARLRTSGRIGAELTGGLDSSTVAVTALKHLTGQNRLPVFTLVPETDCRGENSQHHYADESAFVHDITSMHPRLEPHLLRAEGLAIDGGLDDRLRVMGTLPRAPVSGALWDAMYNAAAARGVKVMLNGAMGNMSLTWAGRGAYWEWLRSGRLATLAGELRHVASSPLEMVRRFVGLAVVPAMPAPVQRLHARLRQGPEPDFSAWQSYSLINPEFARAMEVDARARWLGWEFLAPRTNRRRLRADLLTNDMLHELGDYLHGVETLHGIESRLPLLDLRLVEWCFAVPEAQFLRHGQTRWLVKRLMAGLLPGEVLANRRDGLQAVDWHHRMTRDLPRLKEQAEVMADDPDVASILDIRTLRRMLDEWPASTPRLADPAFFRLQVCLPYALTVGRLVRQAKGANL